MTTFRTHVMPRLLGLSLCLTACLAPRSASADSRVAGADPVVPGAGAVEISGLGGALIDHGGGLIVPLLKDVSDRYVDAMSRAVLDATAGDPTIYFRKTYNAIGQKLAKATLARFDYSWTDARGVVHTHVVYSSSGHPHSAILRNASGNNVQTGTTSTGSEASATTGLSGSDGESGGGKWDEWTVEVETDAADGRFFPDDTADFRRARQLPKEPSNMRASVIDDVDRSADAEFKALRQLEDDIDKKLIPRYGKVVGYVSKAPCTSCTTAIEDFALEYTHGAEVYYLAEAKDFPGGATTEPRLQESFESSGTLKNLRTSDIRARIGRDRVRLPPSRRAAGLSDSTAGIEEEMAGNRASTADACASEGIPE